LEIPCTKKLNIIRSFDVIPGLPAPMKIVGPGVLLKIIEIEKDAGPGITGRFFFLMRRI